MILFSLQSKYLSQIGGLTVDDMMRRVLSHVFTADMARTYSLQGRGKKSAFINMQLKSVIYGTFSVVSFMHLNTYLLLRKCLTYSGSPLLE